MGILDDIKKSEQEQYRKQMEASHPEEDDIIRIFLDLLETRIREKQYNFDCSYDIDEYYINAFLAKVTLKDGRCEYRLLDYLGGHWRQGEYEINGKHNILHIDTHPFNKLHSEYIQYKLPIMIKERIGGGCGVSSCNCVQLYKVKKRLFNKFNDIIYLGKFGIYAHLRWK